MTDIKSFIKKWNGRTLEDWGSHVSKEFQLFQVAFMNAMRTLAKSINAEVVSTSYGHYDMSCFIRRKYDDGSEKYVYVSYSNGCGYGGRTHVILKGGREWDNSCCAPLLIREAEHEKDYRGKVNHFEPFESCAGLIDKLLSK